MAQTRVPAQRDKITPLWVISIFLTFTEVVTGFAVTQATGGVQIALTTFVIAFPLLIATSFFLILWHRPYVLYPPSDYSGVDVGRFVDAMQRRQNDERKTLALVQETMVSAASTPETQQFTDSTIRRVRESLISVDLSLITGRNDDVYVAPFDPQRAVHELLDDLWLAISDYVPSYTFGTTWALRDAASNEIYRELGRRWAKKRRVNDDTRTLKEVGFRPGMKLQAIRLGTAEAMDRGDIAA